LSPLRPGEIPGISTGNDGKPYATIVIVALSLLGYLIWEVAVAPFWDPVGLYWQLLHEPFSYPNGWYQLAVVLPLGLFGWLLERRHGPTVVIGLFLAFGIGGSAAALALGESVLVQGAPGAALAFIAAWSVPDLKRARRGREYDSDLLGVAVLALTVGMMPLAVQTASVIAAYAGLIGGALVGQVLARTERRP
jgi:membrane associated rhomboid family serine protease